MLKKKDALVIGAVLVIALPNKNAGQSAASSNSWQLPSL